MRKHITRLTLCLVIYACMWHWSNGEECRDGYRETKAGLCDAWAKQNYCENKEKIMKIICKKTCRFCVAKYWSNWSKWTPCSVSCATGIRSRSRVCISSDPTVISSCKRLDGTMSPFETENDICNTKKCPECRDLELETGCKSWAQIGFCKKHLGDMKKWCAKSCKFCTSKLVGKWDVWSPWTTCPVSCGGGLKRRSRVCISPVVGEVTVCRTQKGAEATFNLESEPCNTQRCNGCAKKDIQDVATCREWKEAGYCTTKQKEMNHWCPYTCQCNHSSYI